MYQSNNQCDSLVKYLGRLALQIWDIPG
jgi:hypothetical protein